MPSLAQDIADSLIGKKAASNSKGGFSTLCPCHEDTEPSMSIWDDAEGGIRVNCFAGCNYKDIKDTLIRNGLLSEWTPEPKKNSQTQQKQPEKENFIWGRSKNGDIEKKNIDSYFSARAISINGFLEFPPCLKWNEYIDKKDNNNTVRMIVCAASMPSDTVVPAVQRLFIDIDDETGEYSKHDAKMFGKCEGRGVWFNRTRAQEDIELAVGEGVETTLSFIQATGLNGVAALSTSGMKNLVYPEKTETIFILVDSDSFHENANKSMQGQKTAVKAAKVFQDSREGRKAYLVMPDKTCFTDKPKKQDFNDLLQEDPTGETIRESFAAKVAASDLDWTPQEASKEDDSGRLLSPATQAALLKMNADYAGLLIGGKFKVLKESFCPLKNRHELNFLDITAFHSYFANQKYPVSVGAKGELKYFQISKIWMDWELRRTYDSVVFSPGNNVPSGAYNLFRGFSLEPKKGDWSLMRDHIFNVICGGQENLYQYVVAWMARIIQDPGGKRPGVSIVLAGGRGTGKGVFVNYFGKLFGEAFMPISSSDGFTGSFNIHLAKALLVFLDEAFWGGDKQSEGQLKALITEDWVLFQPKGIDRISLANHMNIIMASNENWVVPAGTDERRFCVLKISSSRARDIPYFTAIADQMDNGGCEAMMYDLLHYDYSGVELRFAPQTEGLIEQVVETLDEVQRFWHHVLSRGFMLSDVKTGGPASTMGGEETKDWPENVWKYEIYHEYKEVYWRGKPHLLSETSFWKLTYKFWPGGRDAIRNRKKGENQVRVVKMVTLEELRGLFTKATQITFPQEETEREEFEPFDEQF